MNQRSLTDEEERLLIAVGLRLVRMRMGTIDFHLGDENVSDALWSLVGMDLVWPSFSEGVPRLKEKRKHAQDIREARDALEQATAVHHGD